MIRSSRSTSILKCLITIGLFCMIIFDRIDANKSTVTRLNNLDSTFNITKTNQTQSDDDILEKHLNSLASKLNKYYLPLIAFVGLIGNTLTIIILSKENKLLRLSQSTKSIKNHLTEEYSKAAPIRERNSFNAKNNENHVMIIESSRCSQKRDSENKESSKRDSQKSLRVPSVSRQARLSTKNIYLGKLNNGLNSTSQSFSSTNYFIFSLAVSDLLYNIILALLWITENHKINILHINYICQVSIAVSYICSFLSSAFTTLFTFQRFIAVAKPLRSATSFTLQSIKSIRRIIVILIFFSILAYSFSFFLYDNKPKKTHQNDLDAKEICAPSEKYANLVYIIDNTFDSLLTLIIPSVGIITMNLAICNSLSKHNKDSILSENQTNVHSKSTTRKSSEQPTRANRLHKADGGDSVSNLRLNTLRESEKYEKSDRNAKNSVSDSISTNVRLSISPKKSNENFNDNVFRLHKGQLDSDDGPFSLSKAQTENETSDTQQKQQLRTGAPTSKLHQSSSSRRITKTLLIVSFTFILLNSPYRASKLISYIRMSLTNNYKFSHIELIINQVLIQLYFTSYSVNFFLYSLCGKKFRASLKSLFLYCFFFCYLKVSRLCYVIFNKRK
jgi:hypothetical protein